MEYGELDHHWHAVAQRHSYVAGALVNLLVFARVFVHERMSVTNRVCVPTLNYGMAG